MVGIGELRAFVTVARAGAVARAAELLGRTQPSVSARLASLESAWNTRLFRRVARGMVLTPEGARLLPRAEAILHDLEQLEQEAGLPTGPGDELRIGAGDALGRRLLPRALAALLERSPGLDVRLREGNGAALLDALREGEIDLALIVRPDAGAEPTGIDIEPRCDCPVVALEAGSSDDTGEGPLTVAELGRCPLVTLQPGSSFRRHLERHFARERVPFRPAVEVGNLSLVRRFAITGLGVAPVPAIAFSPRPRPTRYRLRDLDGVDAVRYAWAVRRGVPLPEAVERLLERLTSPRAA